MRYMIMALLLLVSAVPVQAAGWPTDNSTETNIGAALMAADPTFEPSGIVWHPSRNQFIAVGDEGQVAVLSSTGAVISLKDIGNFDLEDVTVIPERTDTAYLLNEDDSSVLEFSIDSAMLTGRTWSGASKLSEVNGAGAEGLTWVADGYHQYGQTRSGGLFYMGWQYDGDIYIFDADLTASGAMTFIEEIHMTSGYTDLSGLYFSPGTEVLYALYDGLDLLEERTPAGVFLSSRSVGGSNQEGVVLMPTSETTASIVIAEDSGRIMQYSNYPITIPNPEPAPEPAPEPVPAPVDADGDGVEVGNDCNDGDAAVSSPQTYYLDGDADGLGSDSVSEFCSATAPAGYVSNSLDVYDAIPNAGVEIDDDGADNDGDTVVDEFNLLASNGVHPYFSTLSPSATQYGVNILAFAGAQNGKITVRYADHSTYLLSIFPTTTTSLTQVQTVSNSGYIVAGDSKRVAIVNGLTGSVVATHKKFRSTSQLSAWVYSVVGIAL